MCTHLTAVKGVYAHCNKDCAFYYKEYSEATHCPVCKLSRCNQIRVVKEKIKRYHGRFCGMSTEIVVAMK